MMEFIGGAVTGVVLFLGFGAYRAVTSEGWDDSNALNYLRVISYLTIHTGRIGQLYRLTDEQLYKLVDWGWVDIYDYRAFPYINKDEFSENFPDKLP